MTKRIIRKVASPLFFIILSTALISTVVLAIERINGKKEYVSIEIIEAETLPVVAEEAVEEPAEEVEEEAEEAEENFFEVPEVEINFKELKEVNSNLIGVIYIPELELTQPVVKGEDNEFYLNHAFDGKKNSAGTVFMDCASNVESSLNVMVYGHNMKNGSMFGTLKNLLKEVKNDKFYFFTEDMVYEYTIFAINVIDSKENSSLYNKVNESNYDSYIRNVVKNSSFLNPEVTEVSNLMTLVTCNGAAHGSNKELVTATMTGVKCH